MGCEQIIVRSTWRAGALVRVTRLAPSGARCGAASRRFRLAVQMSRCAAHGRPPLHVIGMAVSSESPGSDTVHPSECVPVVIMHLGVG